MLFPQLIDWGLSRVLKAARANHNAALDPERRYVVFSDHHKGAGSGADDFLKSKPTYLRALDHYLARDYTLIILGDAEELWEEPIGRVVATHRDVFLSEARFHAQGRYVRIFGNHDSNWASPRQVKRHLHPFFPDLQVSEGLVLRYEDPEPEKSGEILLLHGHQGTLDSEVFAPISRLLVRGLWRTLQILIGVTGTTPAKDACLRGELDTRMYQWAAGQPKLLLLSGHTHRPVWSSRTLLQTKVEALTALEMAQAHIAIPGYFARRARLRYEIRALTEQDQPCNDTLKTRASYLNDGCCSFSDGSVTAYEIDEAQLRLVRWDRSAAAPEQVAGASLADLFATL
jgi:UDP-2,3-diacylglucosamine pyrophosphatase LpxH